VRPCRSRALGMTAASRSSDIPIASVLDLLMTRADLVLRDSRYRVKVDTPHHSASLEVRGDGWSLIALPGNRLPILGAGDHRGALSWDVDEIDVPWLEEMLNPSLILSSLHPITATQEGAHIVLSAVPRQALQSGDCAAVVVPGCRRWRGVLDPVTGTLSRAEGLDDAGRPLETTTLTWLDFPQAPDGADARLRTNHHAPGEVAAREAALGAMCGALDGLRHLRWTADFAGYLTRPGLMVLLDHERRWREEGLRGTSNFSGGSEWRNPGWNPWLEFPTSPGAITKQVPFEEAWRGANHLPNDARHASYERVTWDGEVWKANMLGPNGEEFYTRTGPWSGPRSLPMGARPTWSAMVPEMLDPYLLLGGLELRAVTPTGNGYRLRGAPRGMRLRPYPAVIHPYGDLWEGILDATSGVLLRCWTRRNGTLLSSYHMTLRWMAD